MKDEYKTIYTVEGKRFSSKNKAELYAAQLDVKKASQAQKKQNKKVKIQPRKFKKKKYTSSNRIFGGGSIFD